MTMPDIFKRCCLGHHYVLKDFKKEHYMGQVP